MSHDQPHDRDRHLTIDAVRGFAVLDILLMAVVGIGLLSIGGINQSDADGATSPGFRTWTVNGVLTDGKMRALFMMLFSASAVLIAERAEHGGLGPVTGPMDAPAILQSWRSAT